MSSPKILKINPALFKFGRDKKSSKKEKKIKPVDDKNSSMKTNKLKKELLKRVKDYQKTKETATYNEEKNKETNLAKQDTNLFSADETNNTDFEREFNKSLTFLHELSKKKKAIRNKSMKAVPHIDVNIELPKDSLMYNNVKVKTPTHGCLKNGTLPTFREANRTQKNNTTNPGKRLIIDLGNNKYFECKDPILDNNINIENQPIQPIQPIQLKIKEEPQEIQTTYIEPQVKPIIYSYEPKEAKEANEAKETTLSDISVDTTPSNTIVSSSENTIDLHIPKINRITRTYKYTLGKKNGSKHIGLLVKNRETQKRIKQEVVQLKQQPIQEVKNYLRTKNLIKLGSQAPNDVLRKLYEDSILAGEVTNNNASNLVYNFMN